MQAQIKADREEQSQAMHEQSQVMQAIAERVGGAPENNNADNDATKSRAKGRHPEKLEREVDYATFLQWEKSWNLYAISDNLETLSDKQQTAILFSLFSKELISDLEYRFKIDINAEKRLKMF